MLSRHALRRVLTTLLVASAAAAQNPDPPTAPSAAAPISKPPMLGPSGHETLDYDIEWRLVTAGHAKLSWYPSPVFKTGWEAKLHLESAGLVARLFRVNDDYTTEMNADYCATSTYMTAREGSRNRDTKVTYDSNARKAHYYEKDLKTSAVVKKDIDIPPCVHDIIGGLYALRLQNLKPGKIREIPVSDGKKSVSLKIVSQRRENITVPAGPQKTIRYEVFAFDNQLYNRPGHLNVWLSDDSRRVPVQIQIRLQFTIGTITLRLTRETQS